MNREGAKTVYRGRQFSVVVEEWHGREREIVRHPGSVAVVAVDSDGNVGLVRQLREPARAELLELPAGTLEEDEEPLACARRELEEETGLRGGEWRELAACWTSPGFLDERMDLFVAEGLEEGEAAPVEDEDIELVRIPVTDLDARLGEIEDAKTLAGLLLYLREREIRK